MKEELLKEAAREASLGVSKNDGGPFGAVITDKDGNIVSVGHNMVLSSHDPTNHAEVVAIRKACEKLGTHDLSDCIIYSSCEHVLCVYQQLFGQILRQCIMERLGMMQLMLGLEMMQFIII